jgi:hypothetical protein
VGKLLKLANHEKIYQAHIRRSLLRIATGQQHGTSTLPLTGIRQDGRIAVLR